MGEVYRARDERLAARGSSKYRPRAASEPFEREARAISSLNHPQICTLDGIGSDRGVGFLVMKYVEGETLAAHLQNGPLPLAETLRIGQQAAAASRRTRDHDATRNYEELNGRSTIGSTYRRTARQPRSDSPFLPECAPQPKRTRCPRLCTQAAAQSEG